MKENLPPTKQYALETTTIMKKPQIRSKQYYDYNECAKYVAYKLGIKDLDDCLGKFQGKYDDEKNKLEYRDFWHYICQTHEIHNGCEFNIWEDDYAESWQQEIINCFLAEFGEGPYFVSW